MSQGEEILSYLKAGHGLTPLEALDMFACFRLAARIRDLKDEGHAILTEDVELPNGKRIARYRMGAV